MNVPSPEVFAGPYECSYHELLKLQVELNAVLIEHFDQHKGKGRRFLAEAVIEKVEAIIDALNAKGYNLGRADYSPDINFEASEQFYYNSTDFYIGKSSHSQLTIRFHGFSAQVSWGGPFDQCATQSS